MNVDAQRYLFQRKALYKYYYHQYYYLLLNDDDIVIQTPHL